MEVPFVTRNKEVFQCSVKSVDFEDPNAACDSINQWVKNETRGEYGRVLAVCFRAVSAVPVEVRGRWKSSAVQLRTTFRLVLV